MGGYLVCIKLHWEFLSCLWNIKWEGGFEESVGVGRGKW